MKRIVTHPGQAHRDDFVAVCILLAANGPAPVSRRDPTPEELADHDVFVVDVGLCHEPKLSNFDHHQLEAGGTTCALTQVLDHLGLLETARSASTWLEFTERLDCQGPFKTAAWLGLDREAFAKTLSPIEAQILQLFAAKTEMAADDPLLQLMQQLGHGWLRRWDELKKRLALLRDTASLWCLGKGGLYALLSADVAGQDNPVLGLEQHCIELEGLASDTRIVATITRDDRGPGWCLFRRNDAPEIDLSQLGGHPSVVFAHKGGFVAKTADVPVDAAVELLSKAMVPATTASV